MVGFRAPPDLTKALDKASAAQEDQPSRSEMIRRIVTEHLKAKGYLK
jgi:metal-responsive CopG/Arc/MetJ family transcriptional regulator